MALGPHHRLLRFILSDHQLHSDPNERISLFYCGSDRAAVSRHERGINRDGIGRCLGKGRKRLLGLRKLDELRAYDYGVKLKWRDCGAGVVAYVHRS